MRINQEIILAVNNRNRTNINKCFKDIYDKYINLLFYNALRIVGSKMAALKVANDTFLILFKNITSVEDLEEDLVYLNNENAIKYTSNKDVAYDEYNEILRDLEMTDEQLDIYINVVLYERNINNYRKYKNLKKRNLKLIMYQAILQDKNEKVLNLINANSDYDSISSKIEMPVGRFYVKEKKFIRTGIFLILTCVICFIIAFIISAIPSTNPNVGRSFFYVSCTTLVVGIICVVISSAINKYNNRT